MPVALRIRTRGLEQLQRDLASMPRQLRGMATEEASKYFVGNYARGLKHYAPKRPGSKYVRTGHLRQSWLIAGEGAKTTIYADPAIAPYAPYVQGDEDQAWMHRGRWRTVSKVIADNMKGAIHAVYQVWERWLKQKGLS